MFQSLSDRLGGIFDGLRGKGNLKEEDVNSAMREIRIALLEADVALPVVKDFINTVKDQAIGQNVVKGVNPVQQVIKIVNDAMIEMLGSDESELLVLNAKAPAALLMVGLQGSGKTTSSAKIAKFLTDKHNKKVLMAGLDVHRPAAQEQLAQLGEQTAISTLPIVKGNTPLDIAKRAMEMGRLEGYDIVILDTAGRLSIDDTLMEEVVQIKKATNPVEILLVADAMIGQDAVNVAKAFDEKLSITGIMLTRVDGDARGGAAMSMRGITGKPVKLIGVGEKWSEIEAFHPDRITSRILGMGDVVSLVEKAVEIVDEEDAAKMAEKFRKGKFDFDDMLSQMRQMNKMGGASALMKMLPGLGKFADQIENANLEGTVLKKQEAMILSMTKAERARPSLLNASRKRRIATGSGGTVQDLNRLVKQHAQMEKMMKRMKKMGMSGMMKQMKSLMGGKDAAMMDELEGMNDAEAMSLLQKEQAGSGLSPEGLGPNPFDIGGGSLGGGLPGLGGAMAGLPGMNTRGGTKKNRKKKKR